MATLRDLIVPYKQHSLLECHNIIMAFNGKSNTTTIMKPEDQYQIWQSWIDACLEEATHPLSKWELDFVVSVGDQLTNKGFLSPKQAEILERIYVERV